MEASFPGVKGNQFVVKQFKNIEQPSPEYYERHIGVIPEEEIPEAYIWEMSNMFTTRNAEAWKEAQNIGLNVPPFYKVVRSSRQYLIVTTLMSDENHIALSDKGKFSKLESFSISKITQLESLRSLAQKLYDQALKAAKADYHLASDAYLILVAPATQDLDVVIADFDTFRKGERMWSKNNIDSARRRLESFGKLNVADSILPQFYGIISDLFDDYSRKYNRNLPWRSRLKTRLKRALERKR